ncbi:TonB-dependent siderophore receptor [Rhodovastum atsumiense]|nr:TonB-dependent siderophore receptor [Rhodovastum atsumiense]
MLASTALTLAAAVLAFPAQAQGPAAPAIPAPAGVATLPDFDIPAQPLQDALIGFSRQSGLQIVAADTLVRGRQSTAVLGRLTPSQALERLLMGTGLSGQFTDPKTVTLLPAMSNAGDMTLPEVNVQATAWHAWQPISGYVAPLTTTGTKTDTPLIEAPQSVGVVTRDQIDDQGARTVAQALRYTAGVLPEVRPSARYDTVYVRGFGGQGTNAAYVGFLDGLRQQRGVSYAIPNVDPWLLERIEVLRGPASVLYGQTGAGGLVNLVSRRPTEMPTHEVRVDVGNDGYAQGAFDFGGPLTGDGDFLYRLTGVGQMSDTQYDFSKERRLAIAPAVTWKPDQDTTLTLLANYQYDPDGGFYNFVPATGTVTANPYGTLPSGFFAGDPNWNRYQRRAGSIGYQFERRIDDVWTVRQNFRYQHISSEFRAVSGRAVAANQRTLTRIATQSIEEANTVALDNQVQASFATGPLFHTVLTGLDWSYSSASRKLGSVTAPSLDLFAPVYNVRIPVIPLATTLQDQDQLGGYLQDQMAFGRWRLNIGVRLDRATTETVTVATGARTTQTDNAVTWRTGLLYLFDNGLAPYVSYATSFLPNSGTYSPARGGGAFKPTTGELFETGVKFQPAGYNSFVQAALFQITQQNVLTTDPLNSSYSTQTGEIRSRGFELEGRASLTDSLDLIGTYAYTDARITRSTVAGVSGNQAPSVPEHMASAWADYSFREGRLAGFGIGAGIRYIGSAPGDEANSFRVPGFALFDAAIRYDLGALHDKLKGTQLALNASNLFDKEYISSCSTATTCFFGNRRTVIGSLSYRW